MNAARTEMEVVAMSVAVTDSVIQSALALIPPMFGESWVVGRSGHGGDVSWVQAVIPRGSVSTPDHVLLFHRGVYVGTATEAPVPYTRVLDVADDGITVEYRWIIGEEPSAAPAGVGTVRYLVSAQGVGPIDPPQWWSAAGLSGVVEG